jgi:putative DNA primase/helicase
LVEVTKEWLKLELLERMRFARRTKEGDGVRYVNSGNEIPQLILGARGRWPFLPASGLISAPTLRPDGTPLQDEGYDEATGLILMNVLKVSINPKPTRADAEAALETLKGLFVETPFVDGASLSVALSLVMSELLRAMLHTTPLHCFVSSTPGSGKSEVVDISHTVATGQRAAPIGAARSVEKWERDLAAGIMSGHQLIALDNLSGTLSSNLLAQAVSQSAISWRPLYCDDLIRIPTRSLFVATGNNLEIGGDLPRRTLVARIETGLERPELREFKYNPVEMVLRDRARYVNAALTITLAYLTAEMPDLPSDLNGFGQWSRWVRAALMWLGEADPLLTQEAVSAAGLQTSAAMLTTMADLFGSRRCTSKQMIDATDPSNGVITLKEILSAPLVPGQQQQALREALMGVAGAGKEISASKLGVWLRGAHDRPVSGLVLRGEQDRTRLMHWWVERAGMNCET